MLTRLHVRDYALARDLALELSAGMTALTGETGAGKSTSSTRSASCLATAPTPGSSVPAPSARR
jgi:predicted ATPase